MARISIDALFDNDDGPNEHTRNLVESAEIVVAVDVMTEDAQVVYGRQLLQDTIAFRDTNVLSILEVELDMDTDELNRLCELVKATKGRCDDLPA